MASSKIIKVVVYQFEVNPLDYFYYVKYANGLGFYFDGYHNLPKTALEFMRTHRSHNLDFGNTETGLLYE